MAKLLVLAGPCPHDLDGAHRYEGRFTVVAEGTMSVMSHVADVCRNCGHLIIRHDEQPEANDPGLTEGERFSAASHGAKA